MEDVWSLTDPLIAFGLMLTNKNYKLDKFEEIKISYGERSNSFLLVEYGFAIKNNKYDFVRHKNISISNFYPELKTEPMNEEVALNYENELENLWLKPILQADLKSAAVHRDVLKLLRCYVKVKTLQSDWCEVETEVILKYKEWIKSLIDSYSTTLD